MCIPFPDSWNEGKPQNNQDTDGSTSTDLIQLLDNSHSYQVSLINSKMVFV